MHVLTRGLVAASLMAAGFGLSPTPAQAAEPAPHRFHSRAEALAAALKADPEPTPVGKVRQDDMVSARGTYCEPGYYAYVTDNLTNYLKTTWKDEYENRLNRTVTWVISTTSSSTVKYSVSASVSASASAAFFAEVKAEINAGVDKSTTVVDSNGTEIPVTAYTSTVAEFGAMKEYVYGYMRYRYSNCNVGTRYDSNLRAPYKEKWLVYDV